MTTLPKPLRTKPVFRSNQGSATPSGLGSVKTGPTVPQVHIGNRYVRAGLRGEAAAPKGLFANSVWHASNLSAMKLHKQAELAQDAKHEAISTGIIGATGFATGAVGHKLLATKLFQRATSKLSPTVRSGLAIGGLGLVGDYGAVKAIKALENKGQNENKANTMNKVASILREHASELRQATPELVALEMLKQAGMGEQEARYQVAQHGLEKAAAAELTYKGVDTEEAARLVKAANINVRELTNFDLTTDEEILANVLEKAASYVEAQAERIAELEARTAELEKAASEIEKAVVEVETAVKPTLPEQITKMAGVGALTWEDVEALKAVPQETLTKVASALETPWEFGKAAGMSAEASGDPIVAFCMG